jgi:hypothetical protein
MIEINSVNAQRFSIDGIEYFKNFLSSVVGAKVTIYNAYDVRDVRVSFESYQNIRLNGVVYGNVVLLQSALLPVIYTRDSLTIGGKNSRIFLPGEPLIFKTAGYVSETALEIGDYVFAIIENTPIRARYLGGNPLLLASYNKYEEITL